jgi:hypothetical protein
MKSLLIAGSIFLILAQSASAIPTIPTASPTPGADDVKGVFRAAGGWTIEWDPLVWHSADVGLPSN